MKYLNEKDIKNRYVVRKNEMQLILLRALSKDKRLPLTQRLVFRMQMLDLSKRSFSTRLKNRCLISGRGRGVLRDFKMSRLQVRDMGFRGLLYGIRKASW
jgi:ribosomal protein S14